MRSCTLSRDMLRAALGCLLLNIQAQSVSTALPWGGWVVLLGKDWGFSIALACHIGWLISSAYGARPSMPFCCASRVVPKVGLLAQLIAQRVAPATAGWFVEAWDQRNKLCWKAMAEVFVYTSGQVPSAIALLVAALDTVCTVAIWARLYILKGIRPAPPSAAAHLLLRLLLSLCVHYCQRRANIGWVRDFLSAVWPQPYQRRFVSTKDVLAHDILRTQTPVYSSILCCNNPTMLSNIAAASGKDLEPVRLERLSAGSDGMVQPCTGRLLPGGGTAAAPVVGGTQAYDLARRLVSSAGAGGFGNDDSTSYTSAARKVRVSVKIPDRSPEELAPGWDKDLQINGQRRAVVLFTYIRRGCIQLILDLLGPGPGPVPELAGGAAVAPMTVTTMTARDDPARLAAIAVAAAATAATEEDGAGGTWGGSEEALRGGGELPGGELRDQPGTATAASCSSGAPRLLASSSCGGGCGVNKNLLCAICRESMFAGLTLTLQVGSAASLVRVVQHAQPADDRGGTPPGGFGGSSCHQPALVVAGPSPPLPADLHVWQQVVCTADAWSALRGHLWPAPRPQRRNLRPQREVVLACSWDAVGTRHAAELPVAAGGSPLPDPPDLQLTVRQQGRYLPVAAVAATGAKGCGSKRRSLREALAEGKVVAAVGKSSGGAAAAELLPTNAPELAASPLPAGDGMASRASVDAYMFAFMPSNSNGLVQVELSRGGVHNATAACVLLVSSPAIAYELEQLQVAAAGGVVELGAMPQSSVVTDVIRDFGTFLDIVPAMGRSGISVSSSSSGEDTGATADGVASCSQPLIGWSLAHIGGTGLCVPVPTRAHLLRPRAHATGNGVAAAACGYEAVQLPGPYSVDIDTAGTGAGADTHSTTASGDCDGAAAAADGLEAHLKQRALMLASVGCRLGLNLLRYFVSSGMTACATRVLNVLHNQLGVPAHLLAGSECCDECMTLLHHAARSGSFRTLATVASWLEERGVEPGWESVNSSGLTPLHLLAVVPGSELAATLVQLRWPAARRAWHGSRTAGGAAPAQFAAMAQRQGQGPCWWQRATSCAAVSRAVSAAWRCLASGRRCLMPLRFASECGDMLAQGFSLPSLESSYEAWLNRRVAFMDHLFMALYTAYCVTQAVKGGRVFFSEYAGALILLAARLSLLAMQWPLWDVLQRRLVWLGRCRLGAVPMHAGKEGREEAGRPSSSSDISCKGGRARLQLPRESAAVILELVRMVVMLLMAARLFPLPDSWVRLVQLRLDFIINVIIRPTAGQMRVLPSLIASAIALVGEAAITAVVIWQPGMWVAWSLALAFCRNAFTHGLGLSVAVLLQASARGRFLAEVREHGE